MTYDNRTKTTFQSNHRPCDYMDGSINNKEITLNLTTRLNIFALNTLLIIIYQIDGALMVHVYFIDLCTYDLLFTLVRNTYLKPLQVSSTSGSAIYLISE